MNFKASLNIPIFVCGLVHICFFFFNLRNTIGLGLFFMGLRSNCMN